MAIGKKERTKEKLYNALIEEYEDELNDLSCYLENWTMGD